MRACPRRTQTDPAALAAVHTVTAVTVVAALAGLLSAPPAHADLGGEPSRVHALTGASIVVAPGSEPFRGTVILRDGRFEMVGQDAEIPPGAIRHDLTGRTLYAGWVEPYFPLPPAEASAAEPEGTAHANARIRPELRAVDALPVPEPKIRALREAGYAVAQAVPPSGIFRGVTAVVALGDGSAGDHVLRAEHAAAFAFEHANWSDMVYPGSLMGAIALARQTLHDARWNREAWDQWAREPAEVDRPPESASLRALRPLLDRAQPLLMEATDVANLSRALALAAEFGVHPIVYSMRPEHYRHPDRVARALERARGELIVSVAFPEAPFVADEDARVDIELEALRRWELAPGDLAALEETGVTFAVTSHGLDKPGEIRKRLREAIERGLSPRTALAAVTTTPAAMLGVGHRVGTIEPGKDANLLVATGDLFAPGTKVEAVWVDGERYGPAPRRAKPGDVARKWELWLGDDTDSASVAIKLTADGTKLTGKLVPRSGEVGGDAEDGAAGGGDEAADEDDSAGDAEPGGEADEDGGGPKDLVDVKLVRGRLTFRVPVTAWDLPAGDFELRRDGPFLRGRALIGGASFAVLARSAGKKPDEPDEILSLGAPAWPLEYDARDAPSAVLVRGATIWTCGPDGVLENADLLTKDGRVVGVGEGLRAPGDVLVIDGSGMHVTPGLIDCHSHSSVSGSVNECTESSTAEVRIADVVNAESAAIYRELAGGLTISNLLHGSCNTIGGQNAVIKLRWGAEAADLLVAGAPGGIKFALGENVKRSNWDETEARDRYPTTRMGVEQFLRDRFHAAEDYRSEWNEWRRSRSGAPPRRDLELDALVEILQGDRLVHCHSYRADEILMLMRVAEDFGFRVGTFQHVLEGYKVANELAAHGAGASAFSDWWSYKYEVVEAIPYNGEIMWRRGVVVSFNSDSSELSRRMNLEAAKAVKYGGVPEEDALAFVTINPAIQLGIESKVGSLEAGKDADWVLWSAHPLSDAAVCQQTWIDGVKRFDRGEDLAAREAALDLRERLLVKAEKAGKNGGKNGKSAGGWRAGTRGAPEPERGVCVVYDCCGEVE